MISNYLCDRTQRVCFNGISSNPIPVLSGVPQGSILGPLLFCIFINDLPSILSHCNIHMYADDVQLYYHSSIENISNCICNINSDLNMVSIWAAKQELKLNEAKSQAIIIYNRNTDRYF